VTNGWVYIFAVGIEFTCPTANVSGVLSDAAPLLINK